MNSIQHLKFGKQVQLEKLDAVAINDQVDEMRAAMDVEDRQYQEALNKEQQRLDAELDKMSVVRQENTRLVQ